MSEVDLGFIKRGGGVSLHILKSYKDMSELDLGFIKRGGGVRLHIFKDTCKKWI